MILCGGENLITEIEVDMNISMIFLNSNIYISTYDYVFYVYDYDLRIKKNEIISSFRFCYEIKGTLLLITNKGDFYIYVLDAFKKLFDLKIDVILISQIKENVFFVKSAKSFILELNEKIFLKNVVYEIMHTPCLE